MLRKNNLKLFACIGLTIILLVSIFTTNVFAATFATAPATTEETPFETYTYWEGLGSNAKTKAYCKPMYEPKSVIDATTLGTALFGSVDDVCSADGYTYILDSNSSKVYVLDEDYSLKTEINNIVYESESLSIKGA